MRIVKAGGKIVGGFFFILFFLVFLLVTTIRFEVLNPGFIFSSFERNGVYQKLPAQFAKAFPNDPNFPEEERGAFAKIASSISPQTVKEVVEENASGVFDFLNGKSKDIKIAISAAKLGIPGASDINWSLSKNPPQGAVETFQLAYGIGNKLIAAALLILIVLALLFWAVGRRVLLICGILALVLGGVARLFLLVIATTTPAKEPAQVLLVALSSSILADIALSWFVFGAVLILTWFFLKKQKRFP